MRKDGILVTKQFEIRGTKWSYDLQHTTSVLTWTRRVLEEARSD